MLGGGEGVAAFERDHDLAPREAHELGGELCVAVGRDVAAAQRVALRGVEARRHQHEVGVELGGDGHEHLAPHGEVLRVARPVRWGVRWV